MITALNVTLWVTGRIIVSHRNRAPRRALWRAPKVWVLREVGVARRIELTVRIARKHSRNWLTHVAEFDLG